jgi:hypothetical protein
LAWLACGPAAWLLSAAADGRAPPVITLLAPLAEPDSGSTRRPCRAASVPRARMPRVALPRAFKGRRLARTAPFAQNPSSRLAPPRLLTLAAPSPVAAPSAACPSTRRLPGASRGGEEASRAARSRPRALHRRHVLAGVAPPRLPAPPRLAPSPPPRSLPVEFACACSSFWRVPRGEWSTSRLKPRSATTRCPAPPLAAAVATPRPAAASRAHVCVPGRTIAI